MNVFLFLSKLHKCQKQYYCSSKQLDSVRITVFDSGDHILRQTLTMKRQLGSWVVGEWSENNVMLGEVVETVIFNLRKEDLVDS